MSWGYPGMLQSRSDMDVASNRLEPIGVFEYLKVKTILI